MGELKERIVDAAAGQNYLLTRGEALELGASDKFIKYQVKSGRWLRVHPGVYQIDRRPLDWKGRLMAAVLACGPEARVSHRAAMVLWNLDGISSAPVEVTMPFGNLAVPDGVVVHRSRRPSPIAETLGLPVSGPERAILEGCRFMGELIMGKALDSAIRRNITDLDRLWLMFASEGGRGVAGSKTFRRVLRQRSHDTATDSGSEYELLHHMRRAALPKPELGFELYAESGRRVPDFIWPDLGKAVEVDGIDAHSSADRLEDDLRRQNELMDMGLQIRRFSAREVRRDPNAVVEAIRRFLED